MYKPFVFKIPNGNSDFLNKDNEKIIFSNNINQPLFSLGFHSFLHRTKSAMDITNKLESKNFYYVVNPFEHKISDSKEDITNEYLKYFNVNDEPKTLSRAFFKMWEMIVLFDLARNKNFSYAAVAEAPGSFIQAILKFREKFKLEVKNSKFFSVTIHNEKDNFINMSKQFLGYYNKKYPELLNVHKTYTVNSSKKYKSRDNGDVTDIKTISLFKKDITEKGNFVNLVSADGGFKWVDENYQEQEAYILILGEIITALRVQAKEGDFVLKIFETFTHVSIKLIYLISSFYEDCYIYKPYFSRNSNSEKYLICKNFKFNPDSKELNDKITILENILKQANSKLFVNDIFPSFKVPDEYVNIFKYINISIANTQQIIINKIITYIKGNNYFGEQYHNYKDEQLKANKWWIEKFFINELSDKSEFINEQVNFNNSEIKLFLQKIN